MWMGFAEDHKAGTYRLYNTATGKIILSRDVTFLRKSMKDYETQRLINTCRTFKRQISSNSEVDDDDEDDEELPPLVTDDEGDSDDESTESMLPDPDSAGSTPDDDNADDSISSRVSRNLPGILRDSDTELNEKQIRALRNLEGSFLNPDATRLLSRANSSGTHNT